MSNALVVPILGALQQLRAALTNTRIAALDQLDAPVSGATRRVYGVALTGGLNQLVARPLSAAAAVTSGSHPQANVVDVTAAAGSWQTLLSVTGAGVLRGAGVFGASSNPGGAGQNISLRITIDGEVFERTTTAIGVAQSMLVMVADQSISLDANGHYVIAPSAAHVFESSLVIAAKRSATAIDTTAFFTHSLTR